MRVLLADDDPSVRRALTRVLALEPDIEVVGEAVHGEAAIALTRAQRPDAILLNMRLQDQDGAQVARVLRAEFPALCIIGLAWLGDAGSITTMRAAGASSILTTGQSIQGLIEALRECCRQVRERMKAR